MDVKSSGRNRRAEKAEQTRRRVVDSASALFIDQGYASTTIEAVARRADVAVETVYKRFGNKSGLLLAILEPAVVGNDEGLDLLELPLVIEIRESRDQRRQVRLLAHFSRTILERTLSVQQILASAAAVDPAAASVQAQDRDRRRSTQEAFVGYVAARGELRRGVSAAVAADTYGTLANPSTFELLTKQRGWSPDDYESWLEDALTRLLLDD